MSWLIILLSFQISIANENLNYGISYYDYETLDLTNSINVDFNIDSKLFNFIFIRGGIDTTVNKVIGRLNFSPDHDYYDFSAGVFYKGFELGYKHVCYHPIFPYNQSEEYELTLLEGGYDQLYLKVEAELKL